MKGVPIYDLVVTVLAVLGALFGWLKSRNQKPGWLVDLEKRIPQETVFKAIEHAAVFVDSTPEERKKLAVDYLSQWVDDELHFKLPSSVANALVELGYQAWKRSRGG